MSSSSRSRSREKHRQKKQTNHLKEEFTSKDERLEDSKQRENTLKTNQRLKFTEETEGIDKHSYKGHQVSVFKEERTHVSCRRCKNLTFSLKTRSCSTCGYPKEQRPAFFPVTKEVQVMDLVRSGKLIHNSYAPVMIQVVVNDRMGKRQRIKCCPTDTILQFKKLISAQIGTRADKIRLQKANVIYKDHLSLEDYEIKDGMGLEMYYD